MRQGVIYTGVMTTRVWVPIYIVHHGRVVREDLICGVWESGVDITLNLAFLEEHQLLPPRAGPDDDRLLAQHASVTAAFSESHGSKTLGHRAQSSEVAAIFNHIAPIVRWRNTKYSVWNP